MKLILCRASVVLAIASACGSADVVDTANSIRSQGCAELPAVGRPLRTQTELDEAARRLARGDDLETATSKSGYRTRKAASIRIRTAEADIDGDVEQMLEQRFCDIVADRDLEDAGVFRRGDETWMVLATPLAPSDREDASAAGERVLELVNEARLRSGDLSLSRY